MPLRYVIQVCMNLSLIAFSIPTLAIIVDPGFRYLPSDRQCQTALAAEPNSVSAYYQQQASHIAPERWAYRGSPPNFLAGEEFYASNEYD